MPLEGGNGNSYKSSDAVNQIDWNLKKENIDVFEYYRNLIALRKSHPALRMPDAGMIQHNIHFCTEYQMGVVSYCINGESAGDAWSDIIIIFNGNRKKITHQLPEGNYKIVVKGDAFNNEGLAEVSGKLEVDEISMTILTKITS